MPSFLKSFTSKNKPQSLFLLLCLVLGLAKIYLILGDEIIAREAWLDQTWFINAARHIGNNKWLGPYDKFALARQPGYPLWIHLVNKSGLPLRLVTELFFIASATFFSFGLFKLRLPAWLCLLCLFLIIFQPATFYLHNEALSENFYTSLLLFTLGGMAMLFSGNEKKRVAVWSLFSGVCIAFLWHTRHENILLVLMIVVFLALDIFFLRKEGVSPKTLFKRTLCISSLFILPIIALNIYIRLENRRHYGVFITSDMLAPAFVSANKALLRVEHENPRRFVPVPREARERIYQASKSFGMLRPFLEGDVGKGWQNWGCINDRICDDYSGGWFHFALRDAVSALGKHQTASIAESYYKGLSAEINLACDQKILSCRNPVPLSSLTYINSYPHTYLPYLPQSLYKTISTFFDTGPIPIEKDDIANTNPATRFLFNKVANRRHIVSNPKQQASKQMVKDFFGKYYGKALAIASVLGIWSLFFLLLNLKKNDLPNGLLAILFLIMAIAASRIGLVALLNIASFTVGEKRFISPALPLYSAILALLIYSSIRLITDHDGSHKANDSRP